MSAITRRRLLAAGILAPVLSACATDLTRYGDREPDDLATELGVCEAAYAILRAGVPQPPIRLGGCPGRARSPDPTSGLSPVFQAASLTKPLIAFAALTLVRDGRLDLRAPVSRYLPEGYAHRRNPFDPAIRARVDHVPASTLTRIPLGTLLNHSSGLPNWTRGALAPEFAPGERWQYSGEGYLLLQQVIATVSGQDIETFVSGTVFEPLGMRHSHLRLTEDIRGQQVGGTAWHGASSHFDFIEPNAAASLYTTAEDYAKLLAAVFADVALRALILADPVPVDPAQGLAWGHGWGIEYAEGGPFLWQWGSNPGFRAFAMISASSGDGFALFTNSERGMPLAASLAHAVLPGKHGVFRFHMLD